MLRILVFGVMGLLVAAFGTVAYIGLQPTPTVAEAPRKTVTVLAAARPVRAGSLLQPGDLSTRDIEVAAMPPGARRDTSDERSALVGAMARRSLNEGDTIAGDDVLRPGDRGFLAAVLAPGSRAVSVAVDAVSGAAGLIWPGDRVDVILTQTIDGAEQSPSHRVSGETVLGDVRVIAVDQQLVQGGQATGLLDQRTTPNSRTITLEVSPHDAARVAVATRLGKLQVVLRAAEPGPADLVAGGAGDSAGGAPRDRAARGAVAAADPSTIWGGDVSSALNNGAPAPRSVEIRLFQGTRKVEAYRF